jgi:hypothetical protein
MPPRPSWPSALTPQHQTVASLIRAQVNPKHGVTETAVPVKQAPWTQRPIGPGHAMLAAGSSSTRRSQSSSSPLHASIAVGKCIAFMSSQSVRGKSPP